MTGLRTSVWTAALIRRAELGGAAAFVARKGDPDAGDVLVKVARLDGLAALYAAALGGEGERVWLELTPPAGAPEREVDAMVEKRAARDPDLWLIEIEDKHARHFLTEPVARASE